MTANQIEQAVKQLISTIVSWAKIIAGLALIVIILGTLASVAGHPIPYLPRLAASQEVGVFLAGIAYALSR